MNFENLWNDRFLLEWEVIFKKYLVTRTLIRIFSFNKYLCYSKLFVNTITTDIYFSYLNYKEYYEVSCTVAKAFIKLGLERFHGVCIMGFNCPEWMLSNYG